MKMQFDFAVDDAAQSLDEAFRLVVGFARSFDFFQLRSRKNVERALVNRLIAGIAFRNDEVDRRDIAGLLVQPPLCGTVRICPVIREDCVWNSVKFFRSLL